MEIELSRVVDALPGLVWTALSNGCIDFVNERWCEYTGLTLDQVACQGWEPLIHPDDRANATERLQLVVARGEPGDFEARLRRQDNEYRWHLFSARPLIDASGQVGKWCGIGIDVEDRKRAETLLDGEKQLLEMVAAGHSISQILEALCRLVERTAGGCYCSVVLIDPSGKRLEHGAAPSLPTTFTAAINGRPVNAESGPCAMAAYLRKQVISTDIRSDTRWEAYAWSPLALAHGLQSCWSTPIPSSDGKVLGAFAIYYSEPKSPTAQDQALIDQFSHIASIAIERQQSQMALTRALDDLKSSESRLATIIDAIPSFVWSASADGRVDFLNRRWSEYTGSDVNAADDWGWANSFHPDDTGRLVAYWKSLFESGKDGEFEARLRRFDGTFRWFLIRAVPLRNAAGTIVKWYGQNTDIEDRKRAESLLAGEKRLLEMVAGNYSLTRILEALCTLVEATASDCRCSILLVDPRSARLQHMAAPSLPSGFSQSLHGLPITEESGPCAMSAYLNEQVIAADITSEKRWGAYAWVPLALAHGLKACWSTPISSKDGKALGIFAIYYTEPKSPSPQHQELIDQITHIASIAIERKQSEETLKRSEAFLEQAQHLSSTGSLSWQVATDEITWSEEVYRIFEINKSMPLTIEAIMSRVHPEDSHLLRELIDRARCDGKDFECDHRLLMPDHSIKYVYLVAHGTRRNDGGLEFIAAIQDVTQRRLSEEALSQARSEFARVARITSLGALTASIAHEVNQPLSGIITNAGTCLRMLAADPPNVDGARETARRTIRDGNRASDVITRLRALFSKKDVSLESVDLNEAAQEVIALSLAELRRNGAVVRTKFANDLPPVAGDRVQLQQVILNLVRNASDAMAGVARSKQLVIGTDLDEDDRVRLSVKDAGVGLDPQIANRIFDAFYTTKRDGMGIGLSVSRSIIESHNGRLWATPNDLHGTTFSFSIPRASKEATNANGLPAMSVPATAIVSEDMRN